MGLESRLWGRRRRYGGVAAAVWGITAVEMRVERPRVVKRGNAPIEIVCIERPRVAVWGIAPIKLLRCIQRPHVAKSGIAPIKLVCVC